MSNIPGTNVPAISWTDRGFVVPDPPAVLTGIQTDINAAFGTTLSYSLTTPQGQLASSQAAAVVNFNSLFVYFTNQVNPSFASGRMQDGIANIYFLERLPALPTTIQALCSGLPGVIIPVNSTITDDAGNTYTSVEPGVISAQGDVTLPFANLVPGPIPLPSQVSIYQAIPGWDSVTVVSGVVGRDVESRSAFEDRRRATVAGNSFGAIGSIIGEVAKVPGVFDFFGYDNGDNSPRTIGGVVIAANSIYICVAGGADQDVAQAIIRKKGPGCSYTGNVTITAYDNNPLYSVPIAYEVKFQRPSNLQVLFAVTIVSGPTVPSDAVAQVQAAIVAAAQGEDGGPRARIGSPILATRYVPAVLALGAWAQVRTLFVGSSNTSAATFLGRINGDTLTIDSLTSGAVAIGQTVDDVGDAVLAGTKITAGAGSSWTVDKAQTLGASFTGTGSGTSLTASAVIGIIAVGQTLSGTGIPGGTTVVAQLSGTPGGAGVYETSVATTAAAATVLSSAELNGSIADRTEVDPNADQLPVVVADAISVGLT